MGLREEEAHRCVSVYVCFCVHTYVEKEPLMIVMAACFRVSSSQAHPTRTPLLTFECSCVSGKKFSCSRPFVVVFSFGSDKCSLIE